MNYDGDEDFTGGGNTLQLWGLGVVVVALIVIIVLWQDYGHQQPAGWRGHLDGPHVIHQVVVHAGKTEFAPGRNVPQPVHFPDDERG